VKFIVNTLASGCLFYGCISFACIANQQESEIRIVSMVSLLANPSSYVGSRVRVAGYLKSQANYYLYLTRDHAQISDYQSAIRVSDTDDGEIFSNRCFNSYMYVTGIWAKSANESYVLRDVEEVYDALQEKICMSDR
jgi:hypothetical protein